VNEYFCRAATFFQKQTNLVKAFGGDVQWYFTYKDIR